MSLTQEQISRLAKLTGLQADSHIEIDTVLNSVKAVSNTNTSGVLENSRSGNSTLFLRKDEIVNDKNLPDALLACSPQKIAAHQIVLAGIMQGE